MDAWSGVRSAAQVGVTADPRAGQHSDVFPGAWDGVQEGAHAQAGAHALAWAGAQAVPWSDAPVGALAGALGHPCVDKQSRVWIGLQIHLPVAGLAGCAQAALQQYLPIQQIDWIALFLLAAFLSMVAHGSCIVLLRNLTQGYPVSNS